MSEEEKIPSPYVPGAEPATSSTPFDYDTHQDETTIKAMEEIYKVMGENSKLLVFTHTQEISEITDNISDLSLKILNVLIDCKVPMKDLSKISDNIQQLIGMVFTEVSKQKNGFEDELLARRIGSRDPGTNDYSKEYATIGDLFTALKDTRQEQGDPNGEHYWKITPKTV